MEWERVGDGQWWVNEWQVVMVVKEGVVAMAEEGFGGPVLPCSLRP